ncbi:MAG: hypothetical protein H6607_10535 [Flavobacteriales bacterium]|nr:hypothetical protein [Flavobacteriales bacterium]
MINNILKVLFFAGACLLAYLLYDLFAKEMSYRAERDDIEAQVIKKMEIIKKAQMNFRDVNGHFTSSFDSLINYMKTGTMKVMVEYGDKNDTTNTYRREIKNILVKDTLFKDVNIDLIGFVPPDEKYMFIMKAGTLRKQDQDNQVFMVLDPRPFDRDRANPNHPKDTLQLGSLTEIKFDGNWE